MVKVFGACQDSDGGIWKQDITIIKMKETHERVSAIGTEDSCKMLQECSYSFNCNSLLMHKLYWHTLDNNACVCVCVCVSKRAGLTTSTTGCNSSVCSPLASSATATEANGRLAICWRSLISCCNMKHR